MNQIKYEERFLDINGTKVPVVMVIDPSVEHLYIQGSVDYGAASEVLIESAHALEHLAYTGTKKFPTKKMVVDSAEDIGGSCNAFTMDLMTAFCLKLPENYCSLGIDWITDLMFSPLLKEEELENNVKKAIDVELGVRKRDDRYRTYSLLFQAFFPEGAYGYRYSLDDRLKSLASLKAEQMNSIHANNYTPEHAMFSVGGNFNPDSACDLIAKAINEKFVPKQCDKNELRAFKGHSYKQIVVPDTVESEHLAIGLKAPDFGSADSYPMQILAHILGGKMSARIPYRIREEEHISYATWVSFTNVKDKGLLHLQTDAKKGLLKKAEDIMIEELLKIRNEGPTNDELTNAKKALVGQLKTMDGTERKTWRIHSDYAAAGHLIGLDETIQKTGAVTFDDVMRVAREVIPAEFTSESYASARIIAKP